MQTLYDKLTYEDKTIVYNYIKDFGNCTPQNLRAVLDSWAKSKRTLYKAFGNQFRVRVPYRHKVRCIDFCNDFREKFYMPHHFSHTREARGKFCKKFCKWYVDWVLTQYFSEETQLNVGVNADNLEALVKFCTDPYNFWGGYKLNRDIMLNKKGGKVCKIPRGTKLLRALRRGLEAVEFPYMDAFKEYQDFCSQICTNSRYTETEMVFSIHPLDYMTMSDSNKWSTCMSWYNDGMYNGGTLEMMNSNVAVVCYMKGKEPFCPKEGYNLDNKVWRMLAYVHKDILLGGKQYPYSDDGARDFCLLQLYRLVKKNLKWDYDFKDQYYYDTTQIYHNDTCRNRIQLQKNRHNILVYTYGMYNDIIADKNEDYKCYRNYVKKPKKICLSGYATCLICGERLDWTETNEDDCCFRSHGRHKYCTRRHYDVQQQCSCDYCQRLLEPKEQFVVRLANPGHRPYVKTLCLDCIMDLKPAIAHYPNGNITSVLYEYTTPADGTWREDLNVQEVVDLADDPECIAIKRVHSTDSVSNISAVL